MYFVSLSGWSHLLNYHTSAMVDTPHCDSFHCSDYTKRLGLDHYPFGLFRIVGSLQRSSPK